MSCSSFDGGTRVTTSNTMPRRTSMAFYTPSTATLVSSANAGMSTDMQWRLSDDDFVSVASSRHASLADSLLFSSARASFVVNDGVDGANENALFRSARTIASIVADGSGLSLSRCAAVLSTAMRRRSSHTVSIDSSLPVLLVCSGFAVSIEQVSVGVNFRSLHTIDCFILAARTRNCAF